MASEHRSSREPLLTALRPAPEQANGLIPASSDRPFEHITRVAARVLSVPYVFVTVIGDEPSAPSCNDPWASKARGSQTLIEDWCLGQVLRREGPVIMSGAGVPLIEGDRWSDALGVRAWVGWPLRSSEGHAIGSFCVLDVVERDWTGGDIELVSLFASSTANEITLRRNAADAQDVASRLRASLLPPALPDVPGLDVAAVHRSAGGPGRVLGDFYDMFQSSKGQWHVILGDVCGHGIEAASVAAMARWSYHALAEVDDDPAAIFPQMNEVLYRQADGRFLTMQALSFTHAPHENALTIRFASAGHHPALLRRRNGTIEEVTANGSLLGAFEDVRVGTAELKLAGHDQLVLFTDGLSEARGEDGVLGDAGVAAHLRGLGLMSAIDVADSLVQLAEHVSDGPLHDDIAVLVLGATASRHRPDLVLSCG